MSRARFKSKSLTKGFVGENTTKTSEGLQRSNLQARTHIMRLTAFAFAVQACHAPSIAGKYNSLPIARSSVFGFVVA